MENVSHLIREKRISKIESPYSLGTDEKGNDVYSLGTEGVYKCGDPIKSHTL